MAVITRPEIPALLVEACPAFEAEWRQFATDYADDPEPFFYVALAQFSRCLSRTLASGDRDTVRRVFELLERLLVEGDKEAQEAAVIGLIKNLQNANLHRATKPDDYLPFLLPETERWWHKVGTFHANDRLLIED